EACDVVDDHPTRSRVAAHHVEGPAHMSGHAVGARLERDHVHAFGSAIRHRGALSGLEVQSLEMPCELRDVGDVTADHPDEGARTAGETLETDVDVSVTLRLALLDDVGQYAEPRRQLE